MIVKIIFLAIILFLLFFYTSSHACGIMPIVSPSEKIDKTLEINITDYPLNLKALDYSSLSLRCPHRTLVSIVRYTPGPKRKWTLVPSIQNYQYPEWRRYGIGVRYSF
jgi:hypothetical protein